MNDRRNYYRVLHLAPDAPTGLVKVNYRILMQKLAAHPDLGGENWKAAHLNAAYRTLSDPELRAAYDCELLSRCDIQVISEGRPKPRARRPAKRTASNGNRRNYYRILQIQHDSPIEIIEASHRALCAEYPGIQHLLDEALAFLSDDTLRSTYDRLLEVCDHQDALVRIATELGSDPAYEPIIKSFCAFCKRPHSLSAEENVDARCVECESPLFPPPLALRDVARRTLTRVSRKDPVRLYFDWPSPGFPGHLVDLSPTGMRCESEAHLDLTEVVKVESERFDAVGSVAHVRRENQSTNAGLRFLAVRFSHTRGNFRSLKI